MNEDGLGLRPSIFDASSANPCKCHQRSSLRRHDCCQSKSEALPPPSLLLLDASARTPKYLPPGHPLSKSVLTLQRPRSQMNVASAYRRVLSLSNNQRLTSPKSVPAAFPICRIKVTTASQTDSTCSSVRFR